MMRSLLAAFFAWIAAAASIAGSGPVKPCDLESLHHYPMREAIKKRALPLDMPELFFPDPDSRIAPWEAADDATVLTALGRGIATFRPEERPIVMLAAISGWMKGDNPMAGFFVLGKSNFYEQVIATLDAAGLPDHAALFREGRALFGPDFGTTAQRYDRWSDGHGTIRDVILDGDLQALSERYRRLEDPLDIAASRVAGSPSLQALFEADRAATSDEARLSHLGFGLWRCIDHYGPPEQVSARLAALPEAYRHIAVTFVFQAEVRNGSVEQFFYNSSGGLAPDVVTALQAMGLGRHAAAVRKGIDLFAKPYPRELDRRRTVMLLRGQPFSDALTALTADVDDGEIDAGMLRMARNANILPE